MDQHTNPLENFDYDGLKADVVSEILRQAELRQDAIFQASLGMDQRAAVIGTGLIAAAGAFAAGALAVSGPSAAALGEAALTISLLLAVGAGCCIWACRPQRSRFPGILPSDWTDRAYLENSLLALKMSRLTKLQDEMLENERRQAVNGRAITLGLAIAAFSPALALAVQYRSLISSWSGSP